MRAGAISGVPDGTGAERSVQRDAERGKKISPAAMELIKDTKLDSGVFLDSLKGMEPGWDFGGSSLLNH
jgi:hypothetical protein